jgi:haloalkane dehalogenase
MNWHKPFLTLFSDKDAITRGGEKIWQKMVPGAKGQKHTIIKDGGHFV